MKLFQVFRIIWPYQNTLGQCGWSWMEGVYLTCYHGSHWSDSVCIFTALAAIPLQTSTWILFSQELLIYMTDSWRNLTRPCKWHRRNPRPAQRTGACTAWGGAVARPRRITQCVWLRSRTWPTILHLYILGNCSSKINYFGSLYLCIFNTKTKKLLML